MRVTPENVTAVWSTTGGSLDMGQLMECDELGHWYWRLEGISVAAGITGFNGCVFKEAVEAVVRVLVLAKGWPAGVSGAGVGIHLLAALLGVEELVLRSTMQVEVAKSSSKLEFFDKVQGAASGMCLKEGV